MLSKRFVKTCESLKKMVSLDWECFQCLTYFLIPYETVISTGFRLLATVLCNLNILKQLDLVPWEIATKPLLSIVASLTKSHNTKKNCVNLLVSCQRQGVSIRDLEDRKPLESVYTVCQTQEGRGGCVCVRGGWAFFPHARMISMLECTRRIKNALRFEKGAFHVHATWFSISP